MSSSPQQESTGQAERADIPNKGTPEYKAYYYQQIEDSVHRTAAIFPESSIAKGWLSLNPVQQRIIITSFLPVKFDPDDIDIAVENREELDFTISVLFSCRVLDRTRKRPDTEPTSKNSLLRSAIRYSTVSKQLSQESVPDLSYTDGFASPS